MVDPGRFVSTSDGSIRVRSGALVRTVLGAIVAAIGSVAVLVPAALGRAYRTGLKAARDGVTALVSAPFRLGASLLEAAGAASAASTAQFNVLASVVGTATVLLTLFVVRWGVIQIVGE
jgi:hypothetical protein